ncbi:response regulator [Cyanobacteria bacterium FACHB-471]|nr:response regulator [Cyanobacteria bacterium FACHB-471]
MLNRLRIGTKIGISFATGVAIFAALGWFSYRGALQVRTASRMESHTYQVLNELEGLISTIKDAETGQRGYIITGQESYLEPYTAAISTLDGRIEQIRDLTQDNPVQQQQLDRLVPLVANRLEVMQRVIDIRRTQGFDTALEVVQVDQGRQVMNEIRDLIEEMEATETELLDQRTAQADLATRQMLYGVAFGIPLYSLLLALLGFFLAKNISRPLKQISDAAEDLTDGNLAVSLPESDRHDEIGVLTQTFNQMIANLRDTTRENEEQGWLKSNLTEFTRMLQGQRSMEMVSRMILSDLAPLVGASQALFYLMQVEDEQPTLKLLGTYAYQERKHLANRFRLGEGLVGQCALEKQKILLTEVPSDYIRISSGLGQAPPLNILVQPVLFEQEVIAVIELASFQQFRSIHLTLLDQVTEGLGIVLNTIAADMRTAKLLQQSQTLTEELQNQQEELKASNQQLEEQAETLRESEIMLKQQQEELQQTNEELQQLNEELEEKAKLLSSQNREVERKNQEIEYARQELEEKAEQLALSSRYKSEFLANMSHELRTPLNSLLILARLLTDNINGNLTSKQVEYAKTIHSAGTDLLELINDILDLAKIESGTISLEFEPVQFDDLKGYIERTFQQIAESKGLGFTVELDESLPGAIATDSKRLQQVLKNLLSNALKFTEHGRVTLRITSIAQGLKQEDGKTVDAIAFAVSDTGIGVSPEKQQIIFEAFQQADGTTSRKYGGTGLGLSISRELARLLGGKIHLTSQVEQGSTFTLYLPQTAPAPVAQTTISKTQTPKPTLPSHPTSEPPAPSPQPLAPSPAPNPLLPDDRHNLQPGDRTLLIIEDDINFARILLEMAREQGFKGLVALRSNPGLAMAREFKPDAIMLDIHLPDMDGLTLLDRLKHDPTTRHIPVHLLSVEESQQRGLQLGAIAYLQKPVSPETLTRALTDIKGFVERQVRNLLVVEDDITQAESIRELIGNGDVQTTTVATGAAALETLRQGHFECVVLDLGLPDMSGFELIEQIKQQDSLANLPIIVYTGKELTKQEETQLKRMAETIIIKDVRSPERLLDETALFLHRVQANLPQPKQQILEQLHQSDPILAGKKVLIVDDDVRNIFALTGLLERYDIEVLYAENGREGLEVLQTHSDVDVVLMDVMMPEMDGYDATRAVREQEAFRDLPIIALTAKAMQGDRDRCIEAGASDYISKPIDTEQLLSLLRVWLYQ